MRHASKKKSVGVRVNLHETGQVFAGVDEVGRGSLAGPVVAACCILPDNHSIDGLRDSKLLTAQQRDRLYDVIVARAKAWYVAEVSPEEIDRINIHHASLKAMRLAVSGLSRIPDVLLIDGLFPLGVIVEEHAVCKGDQLYPSISAASILAKVTRDRLMCQMEHQHKGFTFSVHKGYGTKKHLEELRRFGPTPIHRRSFRGVLDEETR